MDPEARRGRLRPGARVRTRTMTIRLLTYNILRGGVGRERALIDVVRDAHPDLVILQEATRPEVVERVSQVLRAHGAPIRPILPLSAFQITLAPASLLRMHS